MLALNGAQTQAVLAVIDAGDAAPAPGEAQSSWQSAKRLVLLVVAACSACRAGVGMDPSLEAALEAAMAPLAQVRAAASGPCTHLHWARASSLCS